MSVISDFSIADFRKRARTVAKKIRGYKDPDWMLVAIIAALIVLGLMTTYTTTVFTAGTRDDIPANAFINQVRAAGIGLGIMMLLGLTDYGLLRYAAVPLAILAVMALGVVMVTGTFVAGARRAFNNGSLTPSEMVKLVMIIYAATWLASRRGQVSSIVFGLLPYSMIVGLVAGLVYLQPDFSTALVIVLTTGVMFLLAGASWKQVILGVIVAAAVFYAVVALRGGHTADRWSAFVAGLGNYDKMHSHLQRAMEAFGNGGLFGRGLGFGEVKFKLPAVDTDSVIPALAEELGWLGVVGILVMFGLLAWRCMRLIRATPTRFGQLLVIGVMFWFVMQMAINLLGNLHLLPLPGVPVPFLSRGGSSLVAVLSACGILISVSRGSVMDFENERADSDNETNVSTTTNRATRLGVWRRNSRSRASRSERAQVFDASPKFSAGQPNIIGRDVRRSLRQREVSFANEQRTGVARVVRGKR